MTLFYFLSIIVIGLGVLSLRGGIHFTMYVRQQTARPLGPFTPLVSVIAPTRGLESGFRENVLALLEQDYPAFETIFVTDSPHDPSLPVIETIIRQVVGRSDARQARIVVAGPAHDTGQKVHNLTFAVKEVAPASEVFVFVDTDARPNGQWLRALVAPLEDDRVGASTGYRWFIPENGGFASQLRSVWNASIASALGADDANNFCWGGSTAIRRHVFEGLQLSDRWRGTVSDDFTMTRVLKEANLGIHFEPRCLTPSVSDCTFQELMEFTNRQLKITRVYAPHLWTSVLLGSFLFTIVFFGGIGLVLLRATRGGSIALPLTLITAIFVLGALKALIRGQAVRLALTQYRRQMRNGWWAHLFLWPMASVLYLYNACAAAMSRKITWRGITYKLKSPTEAVIISRGSSDASSPCEAVGVK